MTKIDHRSRVDSLVETYATIAEQAFGNFMDEAIDPKAVEPSSPFDDPGGLLDQYERRRINGIKTIVFAAMAIEAAAYEFTAWGLGDQVALNMDRMEMEGKWMIATRLICGQSFNIKGPAMNGLHGLAKARNALVHHKSKPDDEAGRSEREMMKRWANFEKDQVPNALKTLVLLSLELESLPNTMYGIFPFYGNDLFSNYPRHPKVSEVIARCREIHRKHMGGTQNV